MSEPQEPAPAATPSKKLGTSLGLASLVLAIAVLSLWIQQVRAVEVPEDRTLFVVAFLAAVALGLSAFVVGTRWFGGMAAAVAIVFGALVPLTMTISRQEVAQGAIAVGDVIPRFTSVDEFGAPFDSVVLKDRLLLIKFFRAHW